MQKTIFLLVGLFYAVAGSASGGEKSYINDPDGYTNVRKKASSRSPVIAKILEGEVFVSYHENSAAWLKVGTNNGVSGYVHKSRIKTFSILESEIGQLFSRYSNPSEAKRSETNNALMFEYAKKYPEVFVRVFARIKPEVKQKVISELQSSAHGMNDIPLVHKRVQSVSDCRAKLEILRALDVAALRAGISLPGTMGRLDDYFKFMGFELEEAALSTIANVMGNARVHRSGDASASYSAICYRIKGKNITVYFESGEMGGGATLLSYRVKTETTPDFPCGTSRNELLNQYNTGALVLGDSMEKVLAGLPKDAESGLGDRIVYSGKIPFTEAEIRKAGLSNDELGHAFWDVTVTVDLYSENDVLAGFRVYKVTSN